ncbi:hypothetical protein BH09GEM1_BH09GEM1_04820 [soil metagenome]
MTLTQRLRREANNMLKRWNWQVIPLELDFDYRLVSPKHVDRMLATLAAEASEWLEQQTVIPGTERFDVRAEIDAFYDAYLGSPFRNPRGGSRFGNLLWLDLVARAARPSLIIDCGTFTGASAWALAMGAPSAKIVSFDIDLSRIRLRVPRVEYVERDWTTWDLSRYRGDGRIVAYFDDHLDQGRRLREAAERGVDIAIFDDDLSVLSFPPYAHGGMALPKISFILDESLADGEVISWLARGQQYHWIVDGTAMSRLRSLIGGHTLLPNIGASVGIDQRAYRVIAIGRE